MRLRMRSIALFLLAPVAALHLQQRENSRLYCGPDAYVQDVTNLTRIQAGKVCIPTVVGGKDILLETEMRRTYDQGRRILASKGVVLAGLVRNVAKSVDSLVQAVQETRMMFKRHHTVIIENDSDDDTKKRLQHFCSDQHTTCALLELPELRSRPRIWRLTKLRQRLLDTVRSFAATSTDAWDYVLMFDGDIFRGGEQYGFSPAALPLMAAASLSGSAGQATNHDSFDLVCANSLRSRPWHGRYRDTFALRVQSWDEQVNAGRLNTDETALSFHGNALVPVKSCFSGLAMYSLPALQASACNYSYVSEKLCEHVTLHKCMDERGFGKVAIHPAWSVSFCPTTQECQPRPL